MFQRATPLKIQETRDELKAALPLSDLGEALSGEVACYGDFRYSNVYLVLVYPSNIAPNSRCHLQLFTTNHEHHRQPTTLHRCGNPERWIVTPVPSEHDRNQWLAQAEASRLWAICLAASSIVDTSRLLATDKLYPFNGLKIRPMLVPDPRCEKIGSLVMAARDGRNEFVLDNCGLQYQHKPRDARRRYIKWQLRSLNRHPHEKPKKGAPVYTLLHQLLHSPSSATLAARFSKEQDYVVTFSMLAPFCAAPGDPEGLVLLRTPPIVMSPLSWGPSTPAFLMSQQHKMKSPCKVVTVSIANSHGPIELSLAASAALPGRSVILASRGLKLLKAGDVILSMSINDEKVQLSETFVKAYNLSPRNTLSVKIVLLRSLAITTSGISPLRSNLNVTKGFDSMPAIVFFVREFLLLIAAFARFRTGARMDPSLADHIISFLPMDAWLQDSAKPMFSRDIMRVRNALSFDQAALVSTAKALYRSGTRMCFLDLAAFAAAAGPLNIEPAGLKCIRLLCAKWVMASEKGRTHLCTPSCF